MNALEEAERDLKVARDAAAAAGGELRAAISRAHTRWQPEIDKAEAAIKAAEAKRDAAISAAAIPHEWVGKIVRRQVRAPGQPGWQRNPTMVEERGIVEMRTPESVIAGRTWLMGVGQPMVRLLLKSGKPGKKCVPLKGWNGTEWEPVDAA